MMISDCEISFNLFPGHCLSCSIAVQSSYSVAGDTFLLNPPDTCMLHHSQLRNLVLNFYFQRCQSRLFATLCVFIKNAQPYNAYRHSADMDDCGESHTSNTSSIGGIELRSPTHCCIKDMKHQLVTLS